MTANASPPANPATTARARVRSVGMRSSGPRPACSWRRPPAREHRPRDTPARPGGNLRCPRPPTPAASTGVVKETPWSAIAGHRGVAPICSMPVPSVNQMRAVEGRQRGTVVASGRADRESRPVSNSAWPEVQHCPGRSRVVAPRLASHVGSLGPAGGHVLGATGQDESERNHHQREARRRPTPRRGADALEQSVAEGDHVGGSMRGGSTASARAASISGRSRFTGAPPGRRWGGARGRGRRAARRRFSPVETLLLTVPTEQPMASAVWPRTGPA